MSKPEIKKPEIKPSTTNSETRKQQVQSEMSLLHKEYKTKTSQNLHHYFKENPQKWEEYHALSKKNESSFPKEEIPRNKMIHYIENELEGDRPKVIADLGCGFAEISEYFKDNRRFTFHNFDHHSNNDLVICRDIKDTQLKSNSIDIVILSLALWGSNCSDYIREAYRILDRGTLLISEPYKRWNKLNEEGLLINKLVELLEQHNFMIKSKYEGKFMFIVCRKM